MDHREKEYGRSSNSDASTSGDVSTSDHNAEQRESLIDWLKCILPSIRFPTNATDDELRQFLIDGVVLCDVLNRLRPGSVTECKCSDHPPESCLVNIKRFLAAMDELGLPKFTISDIQKGSMKIVIECLITLKSRFTQEDGEYTLPNGNTSNINVRSRFLEGLRSRDSSPRASNSMTADQSAALFHHVGHNIHEVFQMKHGCYADLPPAKISEMMKSKSLDNAPTQSLLSVVNGILNESIEKQNGEIPHQVVCLLRKLIQEIERRISTQAEHLRTQNNLFKAREEKYQSRIRVLEALAVGTSQVNKIAVNQLQKVKSENSKSVERKKFEERDMEKLIVEKDQNDQAIASLKQELESERKTYENRCLQIETEAKGAQQELEQRLKEVVDLLTISRNKVKELEAQSESKTHHWNKKICKYQKCTESQLLTISELRAASESVRQEMVETQKSYFEEYNRLEKKLKELEEKAEQYHVMLAENRKLHNEVIELKGNIRVYCRIRPFLPGQMGKQTIVEYIGDNGDLVVGNPSKGGKEGRRSFKFNKVYGPAATQADVFADTQPLIQSVLDGYNVCIFAYGQTGSGKTYTMSGPDNSSKEDWGVNYRALNDLFNISQTRESSFKYDIGVQMVEIYNEQVRDLLTSSGNKRLGIQTGSQASGLAVPDASMYQVKLTSDVMDLMEIGLNNRAQSATSMNQRSSRSHSVLTIHARGTDLKTGATLKGSLHLVDLAGSERVDRSEVVGDRLKEAQHINKSLAALGDVIFALAQKSPHVPYRNSKLTQVLQSSLGGQAKTLMFVQLNPDVTSFSESVSTLKFAERVSGIELGAAKSSKDGKDVKELSDQVASLREALAKKDDEIERLQSTKDRKSPSSNGERRLQRKQSPSPIRTLSGKGLRSSSKVSSRGSSKGSPSDQDSSDNSEKLSGSSLQSNELGFGDGDGDFDDRLSDVSDTNGSVESNSFLEVVRPPDTLEKSKSNSRYPRPPLRSVRDTSSTTPIRGRDSPMSTPVRGRDSPLSTPVRGRDTPMTTPSKGRDTPATSALKKSTGIRKSTSANTLSGKSSLRR